MTEYKNFNYRGNDRDVLDREPFKATKIWNELIEHLRTNVEQRRRRWKFQYYEKCFRGGDVVEVLHAYVQTNPHLSKDATRSQVRSLCQILLEKKVIECVIVDNNNSSKKDSFEDNNRLYRFSSGDSQVEHAISSPVQIERKPNRRRSLLGQRDKKVARRKSLISFTPRAQKRLADLLMPTESPGVANAKVHETAKKRRRLSLDAGLGLRKNKLAMLSVSTDQGDLMSEVWFEVALSQLLQLTDVPFLEDILTPPFTDERTGVIVISNKVPEPPQQIDGNKENIHDSESSNVWITAGMDCIQLQRDCPLPQRNDMSYSNLMNAKEAGIQQILLEYYGSLRDSLIPSNLTDLVDGILCALANDWAKTNTFLPLLTLMLPTTRRKHLRKLLNFMGTNSGRFIVKKFMGAILPKDVKNKDSGQRLVQLMVRNQRQMFTVPAYLKEHFRKNISYAQRGMCPPLSSTVCQQISVAEYRNQTKLTSLALNKLMTYITDNLQMTLREKEEWLKLFQKHHNHIFLQQFPSGQL